MNGANSILRLNPADNVAVALRPVAAGEPIEIAGLALAATEDIPRGHKLALAPIACGQPVIKHGFPIGRATRDAQPGAWVHLHNLRTNLGGLLEYAYQPDFKPAQSIPDGRTFDGYVRADGQAGIRNELWIIPTVGCINGTAEALARRFRDRLPWGSLDGVHAFVHPHGCSQLGVDHVRTREILAGLARHPNAGGVLVLGLGCETNTLAGFGEALSSADTSRVRFLCAQEVEAEEEAGLRLLDELAELASQAKRQPIPASALRVGLKCGGSDGLSGITANPVLGAFSDRLIGRGGTTLLTEVPEMFGAETILMSRCISREVFEKCVAMVNGFKSYLLRYKQPLYENPSPGNKEGGLTTLEEKSLGCTQKGGASPVVDVVGYGGRVVLPGLNLLDSPSNDLVSVTAQAAAGAQLVLFTTGRGTPFGSVAPTVKVSTHTALAARKPHWIDFNAGRVLDGVSLATLADELFELVLDVASGRKQTRNELNSFRDIAIFKDGVTY